MEIKANIIKKLSEKFLPTELEVKTNHIYMLIIMRMQKEAVLTLEYLFVQKNLLTLSQ